MQSGAIVGGDFKILRPLSAGGMGSVFVAEQLSTGRQRAVKLMHSSLVADARMRERFVQEARISATIESDHVVEVVGAGVDGPTGVPFLAMELLTGEDLGHYLTRRGALSPPEALEIFAQLCHGVGAAHAKGIVHRDLKPDNVFLARSRRLGVDVHVKVLDFGIAKSLGGLTSQATQSMGTPLWMAPEQSDSKARVSPSTDVWALGLIAFRALTGAYYWNAAVDSDSSVHALMRELILDELDAPSARLARRGARATLPVGFDAWFARAVVRDPARRFANATDAFAALRPLLGGVPGASPAVAVLEATDEWVDADLVEAEAGPLAAARARFDAAPRRADAARAVLVVARESGDRDLAYRAATLLATFKSASPEEEAIASDRTFTRPPIARSMDAAAWRDLLHPSASPALVDVLAGVAPALARASAASGRPPELEGAVPALRAAGTSPVATVVYRAADLLGIPIPRVFVRPSGTLALTMVHGEPATCVASAAFFAILSPPQALFVAARSLARLRPELYAAHFYGTSENLRSLLTSAARAVGRGPADAATASITAMLQHNLTHGEREALSRSVERLLASQAVADLGQTIRAAQMTAARAGLLLAGDLKLALRELTRTPPPSAIIPVDEVVDDLLRFWLGDVCSRLRQRLGP